MQQKEEAMRRELELTKAQAQREQEMAVLKQKFQALRFRNQPKQAHPPTDQAPQPSESMTTETTLTSDFSVNKPAEAQAPWDIRTDIQNTGTFPDFIAEFKKNYLNDRWESEMCCELLAMTQGPESFWDYAIVVQAKNSLLLGVESHLTDDKLCHHLEAGMEDRLARKCDSEKLENVVLFKDWFEEVKLVDEALCADLAVFKTIAKNSREAGRRMSAARTCWICFVCSSMVFDQITMSSR
ncbi:hypothetical protein PILCRDRAFT_15917 [Piloderma croceum F 1598]|uniref:Uncharacterized protein n=1 Tax=Piloderma croceum (strain F 1598) TaxID=765440 RepID=A0A0C3EXI4_PILCF|nr:hypothetical protein PILCRDRAFT_15917 [Piloderma croceum F 1598]